MTNRARLTLEEAKSVLSALQIDHGLENDPGDRAVLSTLDRMMGNDKGSNIGELDCWEGQRARMPDSAARRTEISDETLIVKKTVLMELQQQVAAMAQEIAELRRNQSKIESTISCPPSPSAESPVAGSPRDTKPASKADAKYQRAALIREIKSLLEQRKQLRTRLESLLAELATLTAEQPYLASKPQPAGDADIEEIGRVR